MSQVISASDPSDTEAYTSSSTLELLNLPDLPLQAIVSRIPLRHLIPTVPLVHPHLSTYRETVLRGTRRLELLIGNQEAIRRFASINSLRIPFSRYLVDPSTGKPLHPKTDDFYQLRLVTLEYSTVNQLINLMPGITHLTLRLNQVDILILPEVIRLLTNWSTTLKWLTFSCKITDNEWLNQPPMVRERDKTVFSFLLLRLITAINEHLTSLEHLTLDIHERLFEMQIHELPAEESPVLAMPILRRLKEFNFYSRDGFNHFIFNTLNTYASEPEGPLREIAISQSGKWTDYLEAIPAGSTLASRIIALPYLTAPSQLSRAVQLGALWARQEPEALPLIAQAIEAENLADVIWAVPGPAAQYCELQRSFLRAYPNLRMVNLELDATRPLSALVDVLSSLKQLQCLKLQIQDSRALDFEALPDLQSALSTVTVLHLDLRPSEGRHTDLTSPVWGTLFPSVQIVMLEHITLESFCTICYPNAELDFLVHIGDQYEEVMPCLKQLISPLTALPAVRKIFYQRNFEHGNTGEFTGTGDFVQAHTGDIY